jgi:recombination protein RecA
MGRPKKNQTSGEPAAPTTNSATDIDKAKLSAVLDALNLKHGKGSIMLADSNEHAPIDRISFGHFELDELTGGGVPRGRITELYGENSSGKTTALLHLIRTTQRMGGKAALIDVEHAIDLRHCEEFGINTKELLFSQPDSAEEALDIVDALAKSKLVMLIGVDSVAGLVTKAELEGEVGDAHVAQLARLMSLELKKQKGSANNANCAIVYINQLRDGIGPMASKTTPGGRALKFYASLRVELTRTETLYIPYEGDKLAYAQKTKGKTVKNKTAPPFRQCTVELRYPVVIHGVKQAAGYDELSAIIQLAVEKKIIKQSSGWFEHNGSKVNGKEKMRVYIAEHPEIREQVLAA